ncbi:MAG: tetratricopeptide repeat protein [Verrucomicrobiota bacterium JB023]|nr:tetratricopeptide repeat protein [Verrucomicrobiota bacterium JB023]
MESLIYLNNHRDYPCLVLGLALIDISMLRSLTFLALLTLIGCDWRNDVALENQAALEAYALNRQPLPPAEDAEEWSARFEQDLRLYTPPLTHLYAELPPEEFWPDVLATLAQPVKQNQGFDHVETKAKKIKLFHALLDEDRETANQLLRALIKSDSRSTWQNDEKLNALFLLGENKAEVQQWIEKESSYLLKSSEPSTYSKSEKEDWQIALAENRIEEAIDLLWKEIREKNLKKDKTISRLSKLIELGVLLDKPELAQAAEKELTPLAVNPTKGEYSFYYSSYTYQDWVDYLASQERWKDLRKHVEKNQELLAKQDHRDEPNTNLLALDSYLDFQVLEEKEAKQRLLQILDQTTFEDVLAMLTATLPDQESLGLLLVRSLIAEGEIDTAVAYAMNLLADQPGDDRYYELLKEADAGTFASFLPKLLSFDPFEERPLIWQAELALEAGKLDEAQKKIDAAIALDPSDGDQGKNSRMKCYHVLARILEAKGDEEKAGFFFDVCEAIREGEAADDYLYAGLIQEATRRYRAALGRFNDAYCLQSRLALTLAREGKFEEAIPHFEKAFELMPVSFGPRESHCLGCEGIFSDEKVRPIAVRTLEAFIEKNPKNPRAPYLLGMALQESEETEQAIAAYQKALELDPTYFNAADRLFDLMEGHTGYIEERHKLITHLLEIAPYPDLASFYAARIDLKQLWKDASNVADIPLNLPPIPNQAPEPPEKDQFSNEFYYHSYYNRRNALDGWSQTELLRNNSLLDLIESL